jgi:hypothetical protein
MQNYRESKDVPTDDIFIYFLLQVCPTAVKSGRYVIYKIALRLHFLENCLHFQGDFFVNLHSSLLLYVVNLLQNFIATTA